MCGIAGKVSLRGPIPPGLIESMCERIVHRGPDSRGIHTADGVALGVQRLRVIDLATGDQPIYNEDRSVAVILNGEIYNFRELRSDLERRGHRFSTRSDTEVIAHLYEEKGPELVRELDGMFAFAVWDERRGRLLLARDRVGKKPLFYSEGDGTIAFASELGALMADEAIPREVDLDALRLLPVLRRHPLPALDLAGREKLPPATTLVWEGGPSQAAALLAARLLAQARPSLPDELAEELRDRIGDAVRERLVSDVPLGALLSGGIDSAVVVSRRWRAGIAGPDQDVLDRIRGGGVRRARPRPAHRRIVSAPTTRSSWSLRTRSPLSRRSSATTGSRSPTPRRSQLLPRGGDAAPVTVALNGDGGDESFAGYLRYIGAASAAAMDRFPRALRAGDRPSRLEAAGRNGARSPHRSTSGRLLVSLNQPPRPSVLPVPLDDAGLDDLLAPECSRGGHIGRTRRLRGGEMGSRHRARRGSMSRWRPTWSATCPTTCW